jgi:CheY-like chemotaxis protein
MSYHEFAQPPPGHEHRLRGQQILVVEDEPIIAMELQASLEDDGAEVIGPACTLAAALDLATRAQFSAAILDITLGQETVAPVARLLRQRGIPFLFYSGQTKSDPVRREWPDTPALPKPTPPQRIAQAVAALLH